ncbi:hypothetical protein [Polyangium jinanense]|uniref:Lipoprotein n=1 Tax=Polyangium jinanense TaxID=2829994 RepID=A0A9X3X021_9BACT|nr:hypothetical protein [Polyangium jinanense]MDC3952716.1 hypothetical protein [Polyangium jinanense]MDC3980335.1 hypothetical protein [Polyangium jinanense]
MLERPFHFLSAHPLARAAVLAALTLFGAACGAKVVVDAEGETGGAGGAGGAGGTGATGGAGGVGGLQCGEEPLIGKILAVCVSMNGGDFCPPAGSSPGLLTTLADAAGVCAETNPTACCNQPAFRQVVCDLPPQDDECCYHVHYLPNVVCP